MSPIFERILIKKYTNRRLYNTKTSSYVTLDDIAIMIKEGLDFAVQDAKTGEDITSITLTQILVERETHNENLLPVDFLKNMILLYDENYKSIMKDYLSYITKGFNDQKQTIQDFWQKQWAPFNVGSLTQLPSLNKKFFEKTFGYFSNFTPAPPEDLKQIQNDDIQKQLKEMQEKIEFLHKKIGS
jgi:polyhydroxyalkanoate synthesis repressor PhaR